MKIDRLRSILLGLAFAVGLLTASPARAQITPLGASALAPSGVLSTFDYDDKHHVYLQAWEFQNRVWARFIGADGAVLGTSFIVSTHVAPTGFAGRPRVAYSRGSGADEFLVLYVSDFNAVDRASNVFGQLVRYTGQGTTAGTMDAGFITVSPLFSNSTLLQVLDTVVFNPVTSRFLVVWEEAPAGYEVVARHVALDGSPVGNAWNVSESTGSQGMSQAAFDSQRNQYLVSYVGDGGPGLPALGTFARILDGNTAQPTSSVIVLAGGYGVEVSVAHLPARDGFIVTWTAFKPDRTVMARFVPSAYTNTLPEAAYLALDTPGGDGGASVTYDPASRVVLVAAMSDPRYIRGALLNANGAPQTAAFVLGTSPAASGSYYPTVKPAEGGIVGLTYVVDYTFTILERFQLEGSSAPPPPAATASNPRMTVDLPRANASVTGSVTVAGWAIDLGSTTTSGVDAVHVWAFPTSGAAPIFMGTAALGGARPDVGGAFGASRYNSSGFSLTAAALPPGVHDIGVYAHSTITGTFNNSQVRRVTVTAPLSIPRMAIDLPLPNLVVPQNFHVDGWALDVGSSSGTGVDAIHVWAYPISGAAPMFVGVAALGHSRPDVATAFGDARYSSGGFTLDATGTVPPGEYNLVVFAHSAVTGTFNNAALVRIRVF